jgi:thiol-disulfide isomerase/thioredoxin
MKISKLFLILPVFFSFKNFAQKNYYQMKNGKILTEEQYNKAKENASKNGRLEELILKSEKKNDSIVNVVRIAIITKDDKGNYFDPFSEPKKMLGKHFPIEIFKNKKKVKFASNYLKGKPTFINFWFTHCVPCIDEIPLLNSVKEKYGEKVNFISITFEDKKAVDEFLKKKEINFEHITDSKNQLDKLKFSSFPTNLILDKEGNVKFVFGEVSDSEDDLSLIIDELLK